MTLTRKERIVFNLAYNPTAYPSKETLAIRILNGSATVKDMEDYVDRLTDELLEEGSYAKIVEKAQTANFLAVRKENKWLTLDISEMTTHVQQALGSKLTAYITSGTSTSEIAAWITSGTIPNNLVEKRLRIAYHLVTLLQTRYSDTTIQTWFQGQNPSLGDVAPAKALKESDPDNIHSQLISAASTFVAGN